MLRVTAREEARRFLDGMLERLAPGSSTRVTGELLHEAYGEIAWIEPRGWGTTVEPWVERVRDQFTVVPMWKDDAFQITRSNNAN